MTPFPPEAFQELEKVYTELEDDIQAAQPICNRSGRCCHFTKSDHILYSTDLEIDYLLAHEALPPSIPNEDVCPYLQDQQCSVRAHRMLGCRIYFCDTNYTDLGQDLYEKHLNAIKAIYRNHNQTWSFQAAMSILQRRKMQSTDMHT